MSKVIFTKDFEYDFRPLAAQVRLYRASRKAQSVPRSVAEAAIAAGRAKYPVKSSKTTDEDDVMEK